MSATLSSPYKGWLSRHSWLLECSEPNVLTPTVELHTQNYCRMADNFRYLCGQLFSVLACNSSCYPAHGIFDTIKLFSHAYCPSLFADVLFVA